MPSTASTAAYVLRRLYETPSLHRLVGIVEHVLRATFGLGRVQQQRAPHLYAQQRGRCAPGVGMLAPLLFSLGINPILVRLSQRGVEHAAYLDDIRYRLPPTTGRR